MPPSDFEDTAPAPGRRRRRTAARFGSRKGQVLEPWRGLPPFSSSFSSFFLGGGPPTVPVEKCSTPANRNSKGLAVTLLIATSWMCCFFFCFFFDFFQLPFAIPEIEDTGARVRHRFRRRPSVPKSPDVGGGPGRA